MAKATIPIYHDDDFERLAELRREVAIATRKYEAEKERAAEAPRALRREGDDEPDVPEAVRKAAACVQEAQDAFDAFVDEASERAEMWSLKPIGHEEFREMQRQHPPRRVKVKTGEGEDATETEVDHPDDEGWGVNTATFPKALLTFVDPEDETIRTIIEPQFDSEAAMRRRVKRLSEGEFRTMWTTALVANEGGVADPKQSRFSPAGLRSSET